MPASAIVTSVGTGICCCHPPIPCISITGVISIGSSDKTIEGLGACRLNDIFVASCGHVAIMIMGSSDVTVNGLPQCRVGDNFQGCPIGVLVTGATTHTTN